MELGLSKGASHFRKVAAELVQRYPEVVEPLKDGRLCITSVVELAKVITPENRAEVLPRFFHTSKKEAKEVSAELRPREAAPHRLVVTALRPAPAPREATIPAEVQPEGGPVAAVPRVRPEEPHRARLMSSPPPAKVEPLTADLRRLHLTVSKRFMQAYPSGHGREEGTLRRRKAGSGEVPEVHPRSGETGGLGPRRRPLPVPAGERRALRLDSPPAIRPRPAGGTWGRVHR